MKLKEHKIDGIEPGSIAEEMGIEAGDVLLEVNTDEALMGGYRLEVNGVEYDKSVQGMIKALQNRISGR